ncbi:putative pectinesterase [Helianthus annuus]|nr:putative pectinesterase [Helianthus annuus]
MDKQLFAGVANSSKNKKIFIVFASILLVAAEIRIVDGVNSKTTNTQSNNIRASAAHTIVKSSCSITLHPDLCYSTLSSVPNMTEKVTSLNDVIELAIEKTKERVQKNHLVIKTLEARTNLTTREKFALHDCQEMLDDTLEELDEVIGFLKTYPTEKRNRRHVDDMITYMSTTITNQDTCLDGFSHGKHERQLRESLIDVEINAQKMCSNVLALIKHLTNNDTVDQVKTNTRKLMNKDDEKWPEWLSTGDRRLLQSETVTPDVVVAADGSGDFTTISAAVEAATNRSSKRLVIGIAAGVYIAVGRGFLARDITFENTAGPEGHQAVAIRVGSDLSAFYRCNMLAFQDTLYVHSNRQFYVNCYIAGTVDFIFGNAEVILQDCDIYARRPGPDQRRNWLTAQSRTDPNQNTGIVIQKSRIGATSDLQPVQASIETYLGRPWRNFSRTVVMQSEISDVIHPAGWFRWSGAEVERDTTVYYGEYENTGDGADTSNRVTWPGFRVITDATEAQGFTVENFLDGGDWLGNTGFPFSLGL